VVGEAAVLVVGEEERRLVPQPGVRSALMICSGISDLFDLFDFDDDHHDDD
jgi:hypothetical protein